MNGTWIWLSDGVCTENERGCFAAEFTADDVQAACALRITAVTRYAAWLNGRLLGHGPARTTPGYAYYDTYDLTPLLRCGENELRVEVWSYGWSTYQSLAEPGGLLFDVTQNGNVLVASGSGTRCARDTGFVSHAPKRNVNLGFAEYYDGRLFDQRWITESARTRGWSAARVLPKENRTLLPLPIRARHQREVYPKRVLRVEDVKKACQVYTVNTRRAFYPNRTDADETNFNAFLGCVILSDRVQTGRISFPNRTWNGIIGTFRIGDTVYPITDKARDVEVHLTAGENFFLMQIHGKYDDLYSHIEFRFPEDIRVKAQSGGSGFFALGPTAELHAIQDGKHPIYGDIGFLTPEDTRIFACRSMQELAEAGCAPKWIAPEDTMEDMYILSLNRLAEIAVDYAVQEKHLGVLWSNDAVTRFDPPACGDYRRILLDFGDLYMGYLNICIKAPAGTILDVYGFENMYRGEIDHTIGLNNGARYICCEGWQEYTFLAKMGMRYAMLSVRGNGNAPVELRTFRLEHEVYATANQGSFECDDEKLNRIWNMCEQTLQDSVADTYADSPTYEQAYWLGDSQVSAAVDAYLYGDYSFIRHNLVFGATGADTTPLGNALTPTDWVTPIPMWTMNWVVMLAQYIEATGDRSILRELYGPVCERLEYYRSLLTPDGGILTRSWNLVDWAALDISDYCVCTAYQGLLAYCFDCAARFAEMQEKQADAQKFTDTAKLLRRYLSQVLWDDTRKAYRDSWSPETGLSKTFSIQTHMLLLLYHAIEEPERRALVTEYVQNRPVDFLDVGSPFMLYYLYEAWAQLGVCDPIMEDIKHRWGEMLRYETTTCWEVFPGFYENSRTRSYCHAWSTAPAMLMQKYLLGIRRESEGFKDVSFCFPNTGLRWCRGSIPTPFGVIYVDWNKDIGEFLLRIPEEIKLHGDEPDGFHVTIQKTKQG